MWASTDGGRTREMAWMDHHAWRAIECITKVRGNCVPMKDLLRCIETVRPACNVTLRSSGQAMSTRPGRPCRLMCQWRSISDCQAYLNMAMTSADCDAMT